MKSKISFFNKTIYRKNFTLFWPLWGCFLLVELLKGPAYLWVSFKSYEGNKLEYMLGSMNLAVDAMIAAVAAVVIGMALFNYLFTAKSANMIHALPVTRLELYGTNLASGFTFLLMPQLLAFVASVFVCLANGVAQVQYLGIWLLVNWGMSVFFFSMVVFCAMFTGQLFALPVYFIICNVLVEGVATGVSWLVAAMALGVEGLSIGHSALKCFSPLLYLMDEVRLTGSYRASGGRGEYELTDIALSGGNAVLCYVLVAIVIYVLAYQFYRKRDIECAGDLLTFEWIKPVFRWGVGICVGFLSGTLLMGVLESVFVKVSLWNWAFLVISIAVIAFFLAEMLIQKAFRVISIRRCKECGLFLCFTGLVFAGIYSYAYRESSYIPKTEQIDSVYIDMNYPVEFSGDQIGQAMALHREILANMDQIDEELGVNKNLMDSIYVNLVYRMKDGSSLSRSYALSCGEPVSGDILGKIYAWEEQQDSFLRNYVEYDYGAVERFTDGQLEWRDEVTGDFSYRYFGSEESKLIYEAILADLADGTLQKYNMTDYRKAADERIYEPYANLFINFYHPGATWQTMYDRMHGSLQGSVVDQMDPELMSIVESIEGLQNTAIYRGGMSIGFGEDCVHIIRALVDCGVVESAEEIVYVSE